MQSQTGQEMIELNAFSLMSPAQASSLGARLLLCAVPTHGPHSGAVHASPRIKAAGSTVAPCPPGGKRGRREKQQVLVSKL